MYEIIGNDSTLASTASYNFESSNNHSERQIKSEVLAASPSDFDSLLGELIRVCGQPLPSVKLEPSLCESPYFEALQLVFDNHKESISLPSPNHELTKLQDQSKALDRSLTDCITSIVDAEKGDSDLSTVGIEQSIEKTYENLPKNIDYLNREIWKRRSAVHLLLSRHQEIRPILETDLENVDKCFKARQLYWANQMKNHVCNFSMMATSYFLKRQRRRNFPKKATRILNEYFESHMGHPYPDEATKVRLANVCGVSVAQVSNWLGNKRIRFKKSLERQNEAKEKLCDSSP